MHRPLNDEERRLNAPVVTTCNEQRREVSVAQNIANKQIDRTFLFDKVTTALFNFSFLLTICWLHHNTAYLI
jgi:hypothetical protein